MKILFAGGGTMGPVTPLLAVVESLRTHDEKSEFVWVGTPNGPERNVIKNYNIPFFDLPVARLPRYLSFELFMLPYKLLAAFIKTTRIVYKEKPDLIASAGGYTSVPVVIVGKMFRIPVWVHQQDVLPILTNKICAPFADLITVAFEQSLNDFPKNKTEFIGNPVRGSLFSGKSKVAFDLFGLNKDKPILLVLGGGSGARWINDAMLEIGEEISHVTNVIHITGIGKRNDLLNDFTDYNAVEFLSSEMKDVLSSADLVVSRGGMGIITELSALSKPSILIPLPNSPQEANVETLGDSVVVFKQSRSVTDLKHTILDLLEAEETRYDLSLKIKQVLKTNVSEKLIIRLKRLLK